MGLDALPRELLLRVLSFSHVDSLFALAGTSRRMRSVALHLLSEWMMPGGVCTHGVGEAGTEAPHAHTHNSSPPPCVIGQRDCVLCAHTGAWSGRPRLWWGRRAARACAEQPVLSRERAAERSGCSVSVRTIEGVRATLEGVLKGTDAPLPPVCTKCPQVKQWAHAVTSLSLNGFFMLEPFALETLLHSFPALHHLDVRRSSCTSFTPPDNGFVGEHLFSLAVDLHCTDPWEVRMHKLPALTSLEIRLCSRAREQPGWSTLLVSTELRHISHCPSFRLHLPQYRGSRPKAGSKLESVRVFVPEAVSANVWTQSWPRIERDMREVGLSHVLLEEDGTRHCALLPLESAADFSFAAHADVSTLNPLPSHPPAPIDTLWEASEDELIAALENNGCSGMCGAVHVDEPRYGRDSLFVRHVREGNVRVVDALLAAGAMRRGTPPWMVMSFVNVLHSAGHREAMLQCLLTRGFDFLRPIAPYEEVRYAPRTFLSELVLRPNGRAGDVVVRVVLSLLERHPVAVRQALGRRYGNARPLLRVAVVAHALDLEHQGEMRERLEAEGVSASFSELAMYRHTRYPLGCSRNDKEVPLSRLYKEVPQLDSDPVDAHGNTLLHVFKHDCPRLLRAVCAAASSDMIHARNQSNLSVLHAAANRSGRGQWLVQLLRGLAEASRLTRRLLLARTTRKKYTFVHLVALLAGKSGRHTSSAAFADWLGDERFPLDKNETRELLCAEDALGRTALHVMLWRASLCGNLVLENKARLAKAVARRCPEAVMCKGAVGEPALDYLKCRAHRELCHSLEEPCDWRFCEAENLRAELREIAQVGDRESHN